MWASPSAIAPQQPQPDPAAAGQAGASSSTTTADVSSTSSGVGATPSGTAARQLDGAVSQLGSVIAPVAAAAGAIAVQRTDAVAAPQTPALHIFDMFDPLAERWQNPDYDACTATVTLSMLNTIDTYGAPAGFVWKPTVTLLEQRIILIYERSHMTAPISTRGSDVHGWRNALNYYGWGSIDAGVYQDEAYPSFDAAAKRAVSALATTRKPVGILGTNGTHAQFITGYKVEGDDPTFGSMNFKILGVFLTDPWRGAGHRNYYVEYSRWQSGTYWVRFSEFMPTASHTKDPIDGKIGKDEWYGNWVIVAPVK